MNSASRRILLPFLLLALSSCSSNLPLKSAPINTATPANQSAMCKDDFGIRAMFVGDPEFVEELCLTQNDPSHVITPECFSPASNYRILAHTGDRASSVKLTISEVGGRIIHSKEISRSSLGGVLLDWDGTSSDGEEVPDGEYRIQVDAEINPFSGSNFSEQYARKFNHRPECLQSSDGAA